MAPPGLVPGALAGAGGGVRWRRRSGVHRARASLRHDDASRRRRRRSCGRYLRADSGRLELACAATAAVDFGSTRGSRRQAASAAGGCAAAAATAAAGATNVCAGTGSQPAARRGVLCAWTGLSHDWLRRRLAASPERSAESDRRSGLLPVGRPSRSRRRWADLTNRPRSGGLAGDRAGRSQPQ